MARKADPGKRDAIVRGATRIFAQRGYAGTRIMEVARAAKVGKGTIYEYFRSKEDLFFATFEQIMIESEAQVAATLAATGATASERLSSMADALMRSWLPKLDLYGLVLEFWSATTASPGRQLFKSAFQNAYTEFRQAVATVIHNGMENGEFEPVDAEQLASALIGSWDALLLQAWLDPDFKPLDACRTHMQVVLQGLAKPA